MKLTTKRLVLREVTPKDAKDLIGTINNINISKWLLVVPYPYTMKDARWWINHCKEASKEKPRKRYNFFIELKGNSSIIGAVGLTNVDRFQGTATIGYWLSQDFWRQGIMREAVIAVLDYAFGKLKLRRINVEAFAGNEGSNGLIKKLGFRYEGLRKEVCRCKATGKIHDEYIYGLLRREWKSKK
jgi:[ribosomal protein S5]-alanine N-acetyltransferase